VRKISEKNQQNTQRVRAAPRAAGGARSEIAVFEQQSGSSGGVSRHREIPAELRAENIFRHESRCFASPASAVPLGTPTGGLNSLKGVSARPNFLRGQAKKRWGLAKGVGIPLVAFFAYFLSHHRK
jgi:hypothetical protein